MSQCRTHVMSRCCIFILISSDPTHAQPSILHPISFTSSHTSTTINLFIHVVSLACISKKTVSGPGILFYSIPGHVQHLLMAVVRALVISNTHLILLLGPGTLFGFSLATICKPERSKRAVDRYPIVTQHKRPKGPEQQYRTRSKSRPTKA